MPHTFILSDDDDDDGDDDDFQRYFPVFRVFE